MAQQLQQLKANPLEYNILRHFYRDEGKVEKIIAKPFIKKISRKEKGVREKQNIT